MSFKPKFKQALALASVYSQLKILFLLYEPYFSHFIVYQLDQVIIQCFIMIPRLDLSLVYHPHPFMTSVVIAHLSVNQSSYAL